MDPGEAREPLTVDKKKIRVVPESPWEYEHVSEGLYL